MRTYHAKPSDISRKWHVVDAEGKTLGRLAARVASILRGKHKPMFTPHMDTGDHVIVINASKVHLTGDKLKAKRYYRHSGYPGGIHSLTAGQLQAKKPTEVVNLAVRGMLPKNPLGKQMARKLRIYPGAEHPHQAQQPKPLIL